MKQVLFSLSISLGSKAAEEGWLTRKDAVGLSSFDVI